MMKWVLRLGIALGLLLAVATAAVWFGFMPGKGSISIFSNDKSFVRGWSEDLLACESAEEADAVVAEGERVGGGVLRMEDGSWVAVVLEHACCSGAGFNATVFVTNDGRAFVDEDTCYCGWEDFSSHLQASEQRSADVFLQQFRDAGKELREIR